MISETEQRKSPTVVILKYFGEVGQLNQLQGFAIVIAYTSYIISPPIGK